MHKLVTWLLIALSALLLTACTPPQVEIALTRVGNQWLAKLSQDWGIIFSDKRVPCIRQASLHQGGAPIWRIEAIGDVQCLDLESFTIGHAPPNFRETIALSDLPRGKLELEVWGIGGGSTTFTNQ